VIANSVNTLAFVAESCDPTPSPREESGNCFSVVIVIARSTVRSLEPNDAGNVFELREARRV
jgi:hypothetical protein